MRVSFALVKGLTGPEDIIHTIVNHIYRETGQ